MVVRVDVDARSRSSHFPDLGWKKGWDIFQMFIRLQQRNFSIGGRGQIGFSFYIGLQGLCHDFYLSEGFIFQNRELKVFLIPVKAAVEVEAAAFQFFLSEASSMKFFCHRENKFSAEAFLDQSLVLILMKAVT